MCGLAFSGKSTLALRIARELSIHVISLDAINHGRGLRGGEGMSIAQWEETSAIAMDRLRARLREGESVVVDDTFSRRFLCDRCKAVALELGAGFTIGPLLRTSLIVSARHIAEDWGGHAALR
jgi:predicted kinase